MTDEELKDLDREVRKLKRVAGEWAAQLHDVVEDRLPAACADIPGVANGAYDACEGWADASARLAMAREG